MNLLTKHLDTWTTAPNGIKKLRELILELAVRGLLVPQNPDDEPASVLLEKIAAEKAQLCAEGKIKKSAPLPKISDDEKPFDFLDGWEWVRLGDISADIHYGYTASSTQNATGVKMLRITDIQNDSVNWLTVPNCEIEQKNIATYELQNGDILIARTGGTIGKSYLVENITDCSVFASYLIRVKRLETTYQTFTKIYLGSQLYWNQLYANSMGTGQPNVNGNALKNLVFVLPPLAEQHRIVAKVDELMQLCDQLEQKQTSNQEIHAQLVSTLLTTLTQATDPQAFQSAWTRIAANFDSLFTTESSIEQLKQTILQLAVMGKLVEQEAGDEPASVLLEKIAQEKARLISEGKIKKSAPLPKIADDEKPFDLPDGWEWVRLGELGITQTGTTPPTDNPDFFGKDYPFIKPADISYNSINYAKDGLSEEGIKKGRLIKAFSILMVCIGGSIGKTNFIDRDCSCNQQINAITPFFDASKILNYFLRSNCFQEQVVSEAPQTTLPILSKGKWDKLVLPLPPLAEQHRIVAKVDELMALCDQLKTKLNTAQTLQTQLADALVLVAVG